MNVGAKGWIHLWVLLSCKCIWEMFTSLVNDLGGKVNYSIWFEVVCFCDSPRTYNVAFLEQSRCSAALRNLLPNVYQIRAARPSYWVAGAVEAKHLQVAQLEGWAPPTMRGVWVLLSSHRLQAGHPTFWSEWIILDAKSQVVHNCTNTHIEQHRFGSTLKPCTPLSTPRLGNLASEQKDSREQVLQKSTRKTPKTIGQPCGFALCIVLFLSFICLCT